MFQFSNHWGLEGNQSIRRKPQGEQRQIPQRIEMVSIKPSYWSSNAPARVAVPLCHIGRQSDQMLILTVKNFYLMSSSYSMRTSMRTILWKWPQIWWLEKYLISFAHVTIMLYWLIDHWPCSLAEAPEQKAAHKEPNEMKFNELQLEILQRYSYWPIHSFPTFSAT